MRPKARCAACHRGADRLQVRQVHLHGKRAPAMALDLGLQRFAVLGLADADDHVGAGSGAGERAGAADPARRPGDQYDLTFQIESRRRLSRHGPSLRRIFATVAVDFLLGQL